MPIRPKTFVEQLMDIIVVESNNGDYYLDGYVGTGPLVDLINKHYPEYEFNPDWSYSRWYPKNPNAKSNPLIPAIYHQQILDQLTKTPRFINLTPFKKDEES